MIAMLFACPVRGEKSGIVIMLFMRLSSVWFTDILLPHYYSGN